MKNEIEVKFLDIDIDHVRAKLKEIGAVLKKPETLMRRVVFSTDKSSYARVRDEGDKIVMTYKHIGDRSSILGMEEINVEVSDYDDTILILKKCGLKPKSCEETKREIWRLSDVEFCIDTWPWLPTFIEIEGPSEDLVWDMAKRIGFNPSHAMFGPVDSIYVHYYGIEPDVFTYKTPEVTFEMEPPAWVRKG